MATFTIEVPDRYAPEVADRLRDLSHTFRRLAERQPLKSQVGKKTPAYDFSDLTETERYALFDVARAIHQAANTGEIASGG